MTNLPAPSQSIGQKLERVLILGDLSQLSSDERVSYYNRVCESLGLNPLTRPLEYMRLQGKEVLYAKRDATDQLRKIHSVSITISSREKHGDIYVVTARASTPDGRTDESTGAVALGKLSGDALANAFMKAETKAKRRVTLSICGLGILDELEVETVPQARPAPTAPAAEQAAPTAAAVEPEKDPNAWKERKARELGWDDRKDQAFHVKRILDTLDGYAGPDTWIAERLTEMGKKTLWALTPDEAQVLFDALCRFGDSGGFKPGAPAPEFAPPPVDDIPC